jgi:glycosyltransferase involved in cell wall biosynthesis
MGSVDRLLIVTPYGSVAGGAEQWVLGILRDPQLREAGWSVDAIVMQEGPLAQTLRAEGVTTICLPVPASPAGIARRAPSLRRAICSRAPSVVMANGVKAQLAVSLALTGTGIPTVWVKHDHSHDRILARPLGSTASVVVSTAAEVGQPTGRRDLVVIEPPRPPQPLPAAAAQAQLYARGWRPTRPLALGMISRLVPYKGVDLAIEALSLDRTDAWELVVIGDDDAATPGEMLRLQGLAASLGVSQRVCFTGAIPEAGRLLTAVDAVGVLTRPGQQDAPSKEGYGIVASEAMLAGVPVVVAQPGPITRRLDTPAGQAGVTLQHPNATELARALEQLTDPAVRRGMGARGQQVAQMMPTAADVARQFVDVVALARDLRYAGAGQPG